MISWQELAMVAGWLGLTVATGRAVAKWLWVRTKRWAVDALTASYRLRLSDVEKTLDDHLKNRYRHGGTEDERER